MRKRNAGRILSRPKNQRVALMRTLANSLFLHEKIKTTEAKAKELRSVSEKLITKAKAGDVNARRLLFKDLTPEMTKKVVEQIAPRYKDRNGGYTRIMHLGPRKSDGAKMVIIELVK
jgi:large subunit ribosomal protein L17